MVNTRQTRHMVSPIGFKHVGMTLPTAPFANIGLGKVVMPASSEYLAKCILCETSFQSRAVCVSVHEKGKKHKGHVAPWQQAQKDRAVWQQRLDKGAELTAQQRAGQTDD